MTEKIRIIPVNLGMVNCYILQGTQGKCVLVDCGIPHSERKILARMEAEGLQASDIALMVITHGHSDHMGSCMALRKSTGAKTAIHRADADTIRTGKNPKLHPTCLKGKIFGSVTPTGIGGFEPYEPEILISGEMQLEEYGIPGKVIETPGHTPGSVSVVLEDGSLFAGDLIMGGHMGKGRPGFPIYADDIGQTKESIRKIAALSPQMIYVGHGGPFTGEELKQRLDAILGVR